MKLSILLFLSILAINLKAQEVPVKIVFDVTSPDPAIHASTMRHVNLMASLYPQSEFEVVIYSGSLNMVVSDKSTVTSEITPYEKNSNVSFKVCAMTMKRKQVSKKDLIAGVEVVPDGIIEIVTKQAEGWGYIKEAN